MKKRGIACVQFYIPRKRMAEVRKLLKPLNLKRGELKEVEYDDPNAPTKYFNMSPEEKRLMIERCGEIPTNRDVLRDVLQEVRATVWLKNPPDWMKNPARS